MIGFIVFGFFVGFLARAILPGKQKIGLLWTLVLGVVGSVIGGTIANLIGSGSIWELNIIGAICAIVASVIVLAIAERNAIGSGSRNNELPR